MFAKHFFVYAMVIVLGFALLGSTFMYQVNRFSQQEKEALLGKTVNQMVRTTSNFVYYDTLHSLNPTIFGEQKRQDNEDQFMKTLAQTAVETEGLIFVADSQGRILFIASEEYGCRKQDQGVLPQAAIDELTEKNGYAARQSNFFGLLSSVCFVQGAPVYISEAIPSVAMIFVAIPPNNLLYHRLTETYMLITMVVLFVILVVSIIVVRGLVKPLSQMANVARSFVRGDFSARVPLPARQDEIYDMTVSFNSMADAMENAENNRRGLIASVSHDLRTPMTTIGGFVDGILDGTIKPENQDRYLHIISDEVKRLSRLASSMVEVSRLESGERELNRSTFDMSELVRRVVISFEQKLTEKEIEVVLDIPDTENVSGDHDSLFQVVYNLVDNAVKFTNQGGTITVYMEVKSGNLKLHVINTGSEIAPESIKMIFDRFFKGDQSRNTSGTGSGLGLYIAKTVIGRHGGDIYALSESGKTEFVFTIPTGV